MKYRVAVKDLKGRTILELGEDICTSRSGVGRFIKRNFHLCDIVQVECCTEAPDSVVYLRNSEQRVLARFRMNMEGALEAMQFFYQCNLHQLHDETGNLFPEFEIVLNSKKKTEMQLLEVKDEMSMMESFFRLAAMFCCLLTLMLVYEATLAGADRREWIWVAVSFIFMLPFALLWMTAKFFSRRKNETVKMRVLRIISGAFDISGVVLACTFYLIPFTLCIKISMLYQIAVWIFYLCFHKQMCFMWATSEKILVPYAGMIMFCFAVSYYTYTYPLKMEAVENARGMIIVIAAALIFVTGFDCETWAQQFTRVAFVAFLCFIFSEDLPVLFDTGEVHHVEAEILEKEEQKSPRNADRYYLHLEMENGAYEAVRISQILYNDVEEGESVYVCIHSSLLSDYYYLHSKENDCETVWLKR